MLKYDEYISPDKTANLVVFLHGYNCTVAMHQYAIDWLKDNLRNSVLIVPYSTEISDKNPERLQWFGMLKHDADNRRAVPETSAEEIFAIYNRTAADISRCAAIINDFIDSLQQKYRINDKHTFLCGFSQGAMLALYTALVRKSELGGAFVLSGLTAGADLLATQIHSYPQIYMFHGSNDTKVQFKTLQKSIAWLKEHHIPVQQYVFDGLEHKMITEEMKIIADKISAE